MKPRLNDLNKALTFHLEGMYAAEKKIIRFLPECIQHASSQALKEEVRKYSDHAADKRSKLKRIFSYLLAGPYERKNKAVDDMLKDVVDFSKSATCPELKDAVIIASLQLLNHYKISAYGTARAFAEQLGLETVVQLLNEMLEWEKTTDRALTTIALQGVNSKAAAMSLA